ncbi:unnamed protein product [Musa hybrid cultivar]
MSSSKPAGSIHDFTVKDARGNDVDLSIYKGKVLLIVNVASQCGLTNSNYKELTQLYENYKDKDFEILAFPCNQFAGQEPMRRLLSLLALDSKLNIRYLTRSM